MQLYRIQQEHLNILAQIEEADGEIAPHVEQSLGFTLDAFERTAVSVGYIAQHFGSDINEIDLEIKRLQSLKAAAVKKQDFFETMLSRAMQQFDVEKIDTPTMKISLRKSEAVEIEDESLLPNTVKEEVPATFKISKTKIKEAIKAGIEVPGASLVTRKNLQIK